MKPYYADYVNHILRFYFRYDKRKGFKNNVDKLNYIAADKVIQRLTERELKILQTIFNDTSFNLERGVHIASVSYRCDSNIVWALVSTVTVKIAKERKLL